MRRPTSVLPVALGLLFPPLLLAAAACADAAFERALRDLVRGDAPARANAARALSRAEAPADRSRALDALTRALADPVPGVRQGVAEALGALREPGAAEALLGRIGVEAEPRVAAAAALAVGALGRADVAPALACVATTHALASVRAAALTGLADLGTDLARSTALEVLLRPGLADAEWSLRASAVLALARVGRDEDVPLVLRAHAEGGGTRSWFARSALARFVALRHPEPLPLLGQYVLDPDSRVAVTAAEGFVRAGRPEALLRHLDHRLPAVRAAAAVAVGQTALAAGLPRLRARARSDPSPEVRWSAVLALFRLEDPLGDELVVLALDAGDAAIWTQAVGLLAARTGEDHGRESAGWRAALARWRHRERSR